MQIMLLVIESHLVVFVVLRDAIFTLTLLSIVRFIILNDELNLILIVVGVNTLNCIPVRTPPGNPSPKH